MSAAPDGRRDRLWALFGLALAVRLAYLLEIRRLPLFRYLIVDAEAYDAWARSLLSGDWLGHGVFYQDPLYPYLLAGVYGLTGGGRLPAAASQALLDSACVLLVYWLGRKAFSEGAGIAAGLGAALYGVSVFYTGVLEKTTVAVFLSAASLAALLLVEEDPRPRRCLLAGGVLGLGLLVRGNLFFFVPAAAAWLLWLFEWRWRRAAGPLAAFAAGLALAVAPVSLRNWAVGGDFVLTTAQAGWNFYKGNSPEATGALADPKGVRNVPKDEESDTRRLAEAEAGRSMRPSEASRYWFRQGLSYIKGHPRDYAALLKGKALLALGGGEIPDAYDFSYFRAHSRVLGGLPLGWSLLCPLGLAGLLLSLLERPLDRRRVLLAGFAACYSLSLLAFYVTGRYRMPLVPPLLALAAFGAFRCVESARAGRWTPLAPWLAAALCAGLVSFAPAPRTDHDRSDFSGAWGLLNYREYAEAAKAFEALLPRNASCPSVQLNLGLAYRRLGRDEESFQAYWNAYALRSTDLRESMYYRQIRAHAREALRELCTKAGPGRVFRPADVMPEGPCGLEGKRFAPDPSAPAPCGR